jgi:hypothetical protein
MLLQRGDRIYITKMSQRHNPAMTQVKILGTFFGNQLNHLIKCTLMF